MAGICKREGSSRYWGQFRHKGTRYRRSLDTVSQRVAQERFHAWVAEVREGRWGNPARLTWDEAVRKFTTDHFPRIKPKSSERYIVSLLSICARIKVDYLDEIGSSHLSAFETARRAEGVSNSTIRRDITCLATIMSCAEDWERHTGNAAAAYLKTAKKRGLKESPPRVRYLTHDEERAILQYAADKMNSRHARDRHGYTMFKAAVEFAIDSGLRKEELHDLRKGHLDFGRSEVNVPKEITKSARPRSVPLLGRSIATLQTLPQNTRADYVFWHRDGQRYFSLYKQLVSVCKRLKIQDIEWHDLRRTCGVRLLRGHHLSMERVSLWLGHSSVAVTERCYAFLEVDDLHKAVAASPMTGSNEKAIGHISGHSSKTNSRG